MFDYENKIITEYEIIITVEIATDTQEQQSPAYKKFKARIWAEHGQPGEVMITNIRKA